MANKYFDFGKVKRSFLTTKLLDSTVLAINMPRKRTFEKMQAINSIDEDDTGDTEVYNELLELMSEILSNNMTNKEITAEDLENQGYNIELIVMFLKQYSDFVNSIKNNPN